MEKGTKVQLCNTVKTIDGVQTQINQLSLQVSFKKSKMWVVLKVVLFLI